MPNWSLADVLSYHERQRKTERPKKPKDCHAGNAAVLERNFTGLITPTNTNEETLSPAIIVCYTSVRKRLVDFENLASKWFTDTLCHTIDPTTSRPFLPGDSPKLVYVEHRQRQCKKDEPEHVIIDIIYENQIA